MHYTRRRWSSFASTAVEIGCLILITGAICVEAQDAVKLKKLYQDLLGSYNPLVRPVKNESEPVYVEVNLKLQQIIKVDFEEVSLTSKYVFESVWYDYQLEWNPASHDQITEIRIPASSIWRPDIVVYNDLNRDVSYNESQIVFHASIARVHRSGRISMSSSVFSKTHCEYDKSRYLFGKQRCAIKFGAWTHDGKAVDLRLKPRPYEPGVVRLVEESGPSRDGVELDPEDFVANPNWRVANFYSDRRELFYTCCTDLPFVDVIIYFELERPVGPSVTTLVLPWILLTFLAPFAFILPTTSTLKLVYPLIYLLVLLATFVGSPIFINMSECYNFTTIIAVLVLISNSAFMNLRTRKDSPPKFLNTAIDKVLAYYLLLLQSKQLKSGTSEEQQVEPTSTTRLNEDVEEPGSQRDWNEVAQILNLFSYLLFNTIVAVGVVSIIGSGI